jgi:hypothetical protein
MSPTDCFTGLYARPKVATDLLKIDRWYAVWVKSGLPDQIFTATDASENIMLPVDGCDFSLEPVNMYLNPVIALAELDMESLDESTKECFEDYMDRNSHRTHVEVVRQSGLSNKWLDVSFRDYSFSIPVESVTNPKPESEMIIEPMERVMAQFTAASLVGTPLWLYDHKSMGGNMEGNFADMGHCLVRVVSFDHHRPTEIYVTGGNSLRLKKWRHVLVPPDMRIREDMWVVPRGSAIPEIVTGVSTDYITTKRAENRGLSYLETQVRPLTPLEQAEVDEAMKPKPMTMEKAIEQLGPTLHDMIMRFPANMFTRGTVFQRIQDQLPKECDTGEKIMEYIIAHPGPMVDPNLNWPTLPPERTYALWQEWIMLVNSMAPPPPAADAEPADDELVKIAIRFKRQGIEFRREKVSEVFDGEINVPYHVYREGHAGIEDYLVGLDPAAEPGLIMQRDNRRTISREREDDNEEIELSSFARLTETNQLRGPVYPPSPPYRINTDIAATGATTPNIQAGPPMPWANPAVMRTVEAPDLERTRRLLEELNEQATRAVGMPAAAARWPDPPEERLPRVPTPAEIEEDDAATLRELFGEAPIREGRPIADIVGNPDEAVDRPGRARHDEAEEERPF